MEAEAIPVHYTRVPLGRAVRIDPIKPTSKAPGTKRLKLKYDKVLSSLAFKFNLRRYTWGRTRRPVSAASSASW
jgi:hypothetical protein